MKNRRAIDEPLFVTHFYMIVIVSVVIIISTNAVVNSDDRPNHLTFFACAELRVLCYAWACMGILLMSWSLKLGWLVPVTLSGMWLFPALIAPFFSRFLGGDPTGQVQTRWGIVVGVILGITIDQLIRRYKFSRLTRLMLDEKNIGEKADSDLHR